MKRILVTSFFVGALFAANAQQKKPAAKPSSKPTTGQTAGKTSATGSINQSNYGTVVEYLNDIVDCLNKQQPEMRDREKYVTTWSNYYVYDKSGSKNKVIYSPYFRYDLAKNSASCTKGAPPSIMGAADVAFYNENYPALIETFKQMALVWNDLATYDRSAPPEREYGKKKCEELLSLENKYYEIRGKLSKRGKELQRQLFPYSVANSPYKTAYVNMHNDLIDVQDFAGAFDSYEDMLTKKDSLTTILTQLDKNVSNHTLYATENETPNGYKDYYEYVSKFVSRARALLNSETLTVKQKDEAISNYTSILKYVVPSYNRAMN